MTDQASARGNCDETPCLPPSSAAIQLRLSQNAAVACTVAAPVTLLGSRRDCQLPIEHPDVSKLHAALIHTGTDVLLCDLRSRTGTFVNEQPIRLAALHAGDAVRLGPVAVEILGLEVMAAAGGLGGNGAYDPTRLPEPLRLTLEGRQVEVVANGAVVGRRNLCDVVLETPDTSLAHALLYAVSGRPAVYDLGSRTGTFVGDERITNHWLSDGDVLTIGGIQIAVDWKGAVEPPPAAEEAVAEAATESAESAVDVPRSGAPNLDLDDIESSIATLHQFIAAARGKLDERAAEVDAREAQLVVREEEIAAQLAGFEQREASVVARQRELEESAADLERRQTEISQSEQELEAQFEQQVQQEARLEELRMALEHERAGLGAEREQVGSERAAIEGEKGEIAARNDEINRRQAELEGWASELEQRRVELEGAQQELAARARETEQRARQIEQDRSALDGERQSIEQQRAELDRLRGEHDAAAAALSEQRAALAAESAEVDAQRSALQQREQELAERETSREAEYAEREAALEELECELSAREARLADREAVDQAASSKIEEFRHALREATELFAGAAGTSAPAPAGRPAGAAGGKPAPATARANGNGKSAVIEVRPQPAVKPPANSGTNGRSTNRSNGHTNGHGRGGNGKAAMLGGGEPLPAPVVDEPLFSAPGAPPEGWPDDLRERFRVLRRVSNKSDAEIAEQVWAESAERAAEVRHADDDAERKRKKRRWWS